MDAASFEEKVVELQIVGSASDNTIGRTLKNILQPHRKGQQWVIAPEASAAFVANMEDVLEVYQRPHDPKRPSYASMKRRSNSSPRRAPIAAAPGTSGALRLRIRASAWPICS